MWRRSWIAILALIALIALLSAPLAAEAHTVPTPPVNLIAEIVEGGGVALTWDAPSEDAESVTGYQILRRLPLQGEPRPTLYVADTGSTETTYTDEDATAAGEQYNYRVKALRGDQVSEMSNLAKVVIPQAEPEPLPTEPSEDDTSAWTEQQLSPQLLIAKAGAGFVQLSWDAPVGDAESVTGYEVSRRRANRGEAALKTLVADTGATDTSLVDSTANEEGVFYEYRVRARRSADASEWSNLAAAVGQGAATIESPDPESAKQPTARRAAARFQPQAHVPSKDIVLSFFNASHAHVSQIKVVGIHMTTDHVYIGTTGGGISAVWMFGRSTTLLEQRLPLDFAPRGLTASSAHLYVLDASGTAHAYDLETLTSASSNEITFALRGTDNPAASLRGVHALAAYAPGFTGPDSGMGLVYAARRFAAGIDKWEVVGPPGVGVHLDELGRLGITSFDGADVATDLSTHLFVENGDGDGVYVFELQSSGSAELSERPELHFGRNGHDGLYYDGSLLWTLDVESYEWGQHAYTLTLRAYDPARRTDLPDPLPVDFKAGNCGIKGPVNVEDIDDPGGLLLPDLVSCPSEYSIAEVVSAPDGAELYALRFAGYVTNLGAGPLDLKGNPQLADDADPTSHYVWQRAMTGDGGWVNLFNKPPIIFQQADGHNHFHVMGIVEYSLWDASGTVEVSSGSKVGFCLVDMSKRSDLHPDPGPQRYDWTHPSISFCQQNEPGATTLRMGISKGWQDVYAWNTALQWVDVSDVRPGYYRLGQRADPENVIVESDETNNGLKLSHSWHMVPGYVARPATIRVDPGATVRFKLSADEYFDGGILEDESTRAHRIVTQPSHGRLDVDDTITVTIDGARHQAFTDEWVTYSPDPGYVGSDSFTFVALDESRPGYPINPVVAKVTLHVIGLDSPASGEPIIEGIAEVGRTLAASTSEITDPNGVDNTTYSYQWIRNDGTADMDIPGATSSQYLLTIHDLGTTIAVRVNFTDDLGFQETLTSSHTGAVATLSNNPAGGAPIIGGLDSYGTHLHLDMSSIYDDDGLANVNYSYQWIRNDGTADTDIPGATSSEYAVRRGDHRRTIAVRVSFVDDVGFSESLASELTSEVSFPLTSNRPNFAPTGAPTISGVPNVGETLTADTSSISDMNNLESAIFRYRWIAHDGTRYRNIPGARSDHYVLTTDDVGKLIAVKVIFVDDSAFRESLTSEPTTGVLDTSPRPATGAPIIHGTAEVGETLTADISGIWDPNGFDNATITYQWISNDGTTETRIPWATSSDYTLTADDVGKEMTVSVSFTDFLGALEDLTSEPTDTVAALPVITLAAANVNEDSLVLTYGEALDETVSLPVGAFAVMVDGNARPVPGTLVSGSAVTLVLATQVRANQIVLVSYAKPAGQDYIRNTMGHAGESFADHVVINDTQPPGVPQGLTATAHENGTVSLAWNDPADPTITGYQVLRHITGVDSPGAFSILVDDTGSAAPSYLDGSVIAGANYIYAVRARSRNGLSDQSANVAVDTPAPPTLSVENASATEGSAVEFTVTLSREAADSVTVQYSTSDGTATSDANHADGQDYSSASAQTLTFAPGETVKTIGIPTGNDTVDEDDEAFTLTLSAPSQNAEVGSNASATGTIVNDDVPSVTVSFGESSYTVNEGSDVTVRVTLSADPERMLEIPISKANLGGAATDDYSGVPASVTFVSGDTDEEFTFSAASDAMGDDGESVKLTFGILPDGVSEGATRESVILIVDDQAELYDATLKDVTLTDPNDASIVLTPLFDPLVDTYEASVPNDVATITIAATKNHGGATLEFIDGVDAVQTSDTSEIDYNIDVGDNLVEVEVTSANGNEVKRYTVTVTRAASDDATLGALELQDAHGNPIELTPAFDPAITEYDVSVPNGVESVTLTTTKSHAGASVVVPSSSGANQPDQAAVDLSVGGNLITATVTAEDGTAVMIYTVSVERAEPEWSATLTVGTDETLVPVTTGYSRWSMTGTELSTNEFTIDGISYKVMFMFHLSEGLYFTLSKELPTDFILRIGSYEFAGRDSSIGRSNWKGNYWWGQKRFSWTPGETVEVTLSMDRTVLPTREQAPPSGYFSNVTANDHNGVDSFQFRLNFTRSVDITDSNLKDHALVVRGGSVSKVRAVTGGRVWLITVEPDSSDDVTISLHETASCQELGAVCSVSGESLYYYPTLTAPFQQTGSQSANSPATGAPVITGVPRVGETLTVDTSLIEDQDGLTNVAYGYQWLADDADIAGATARAYTLTADDEGAIIQVRVTFTDDGGHEESLTSKATDAVAAAEPAEPPAPPTGLTAAASHDQVVLSWDDPQDDTITGYVILRRNRSTTAPGEFTELVADTGSAANTYTDHRVAAETLYTYRIKAINDHGLSELSRWVRADTPAPPVPATPTGLTATASHEQVVLSWDDPQDDSITGYVILRRNRATTAPGEFTELVADTGSAANTYADDSMSADTSYTYRIKAINEHGVSELSRWARADTPEAP